MCLFRIIPCLCKTVGFNCFTLLLFQVFSFLTLEEKEKTDMENTRQAVSVPFYSSWTSLQLILCLTPEPWISHWSFLGHCLLANVIITYLYSLNEWTFWKDVEFIVTNPIQPASNTWYGLLDHASTRSSRKNWKDFIDIQQVLLSVFLWVYCKL